MPINLIKDSPWPGVNPALPLLSSPQDSAKEMPTWGPSLEKTSEIFPRYPKAKELQTYQYKGLLKSKSPLGL